MPCTKKRDFQGHGVTCVFFGRLFSTIFLFLLLSCLFYPTDEPNAIAIMDIEPLSAMQHAGSVLRWDLVADERWAFDHHTEMV